MMGTTTDKQREARKRNFLIKRLRGAYYTLNGIDSLDALSAQVSIDNVIHSLGAEREADRRYRLRKELEEE